MQEFTTTGQPRQRETLQRYSSLTKKMAAEEKQLITSFPSQELLDEPVPLGSPALEASSRDVQYMLQVAQHLKRTRDFTCTQLFKQLVGCGRACADTPCEEGVVWTWTLSVSDSHVVVLLSTACRTWRSPRPLSCSTNAPSTVRE